jgi:hypothetical protein
MFLYYNLKLFETRHFTAVVATDAAAIHIAPHAIASGGNTPAEPQQRFFVFLFSSCSPASSQELAFASWPELADVLLTAEIVARSRAFRVVSNEAS